MNKLVKLIILRVALIFTILFISLLIVSKSEAVDVFKLDELNITYRDYAILNPQNRPLLIYPESAKEGLNLNTNIDLWKYGYFDSSIESLTTSGQYRGIGLQLGLGVRVTDCLLLGYWHHSQHVLDRQESMPGLKYPVEDAVQVQLVIFHARPGRDSIF